MVFVSFNEKTPHAYWRTTKTKIPNAKKTPLAYWRTTNTKIPNAKKTPLA